MGKTAMTPAGVLFSTMKRQCGISYKQLAACILSNQPLTGGVSPASRADDRTWVSRYIVHAPVETLQEAYFADFGKSALRILSRLKSSKKRPLGNQEVLDLINGPEGRAMEDALAACGQDVSLYRNMLVRLSDERQFTLAERAEIAMVLFVAAGCSANVREATAYAMDFAQEIHGSGVATPLVTPNSSEERRMRMRAQLDERATLGLLRVVDGLVVGTPHWLNGEEGRKTTIGTLALEEGSITDVAEDVSAHHAALWRDEATGEWLVEGLGSKHGSLLVDGATRETKVVEPPKAERGAWSGQPVPLHPGDELLLGADTRFVVIAGVRE